MTSFNDAQFFVLVLDASQVRAQILYELSVPTAFEAQPYFTALAFMIREVRKRAEYCVKSGE